MKASVTKVGQLKILLTKEELSKAGYKLGQAIVSKLNGESVQLQPGNEAAPPKTQGQTRISSLGQNSFAISVSPCLGTGKVAKMPVSWGAGTKEGEINVELPEALFQGAPIEKGPRKRLSPPGGEQAALAAAVDLINRALDAKVAEAKMKDGRLQVRAWLTLGG